MNSIMLRLAHRNNGSTVIQATDEYAEYFKIGSHFLLQYADKRLMIAKTSTGSTVCRKPTAYRCGGYNQMLERVCLESWLPSFSIDFAQFEVEEGCLFWTRPPVWELPWTQQAPTRNAANRARHGFQMRLESCKRNNGKPQFVTQAAASSWAKGSMEAGDWARTVNSVYPKGLPV